MNNSRYGFLALLGLGGFYAYRNRFRIQQFLESKGINTHLDTSNLKNTFRSGFAKISGRVENNLDQIQPLSDDVKRAV